MVRAIKARKGGAQGYLPLAEMWNAAEGGQYGVYQLFTRDGALLYVGRTRSLADRLDAHAETQQWWPLVDFGQWIPVDNYGEAVALERSSIEQDAPMFNRIGGAPLFNGRAMLPDSTVHDLLEMYAESDTRRGARRLDAFMAALRGAGWTLAAIGEPIGITRERVRQRVARIQAEEWPTDVEIPEVPTYTRPTPKVQVRKVWPSLDSVEAEEMRTLRALATKCRGVHGPDHPYRQASERLSEMVAEAKLRGVRNRELAEAMGVTVGAVVMRLKTHGYFRTPPSQPRVGAKIHPLLAAREAAPSDKCRRGHAMSGENLRLINGDPERRVCRACERMRTARYQAGKAARARGVSA